MSETDRTIHPVVQEALDRIGKHKFVEIASPELRRVAMQSLLKRGRVVLETEPGLWYFSEVGDPASFNTRILGTHESAMFIDEPLVPGPEGSTSPATKNEETFRRVSVEWLPYLDPENASPIFGGIVWGPTVCSWTPGALAYIEDLTAPDHVVEKLTEQKP